MILEQVDYSIKVSNYHKKLIAGIALTGGGAQLKNIKDLCELITATDTRIGIPNEHLDTSSVAFDELAHPMYATGIGLVLYGIEQSELENEGFEEDFFKEETSLKPAEETKRREGSHVDIFENMSDAPVTPEPVQDEEETKPNKKQPKKPKGESFDGRLKDFFGKVFGETGIDD